MNDLLAKTATEFLTSFPEAFECRDDGTVYKLGSSPFEKGSCLSSSPKKRSNVSCESAETIKKLQKSSDKSTVRKSSVTTFSCSFDKQRKSSKTPLKSQSKKSSDLGRWRVSADLNCVGVNDYSDPNRLSSGQARKSLTAKPQKKVEAASLLTPYAHGTSLKLAQ